MNRTRVRTLALVGATTAITLSVLGTVTAGQSGDIMARPSVSIGMTKTQTTAPKTLEVPVAAPSITGPAALPPEERGLPG